MQNNILNLFFFIVTITFFSSIKALSYEQFIFDVTELEILDEGNIVKGLGGGTAKTDDNIKIKANEFIYNKQLNLLEAKGKVSIIDDAKNLVIYSDQIKYFKNEEKSFH